MLMATALGGCVGGAGDATPPAAMSSRSAALILAMAVARTTVGGGSTDGGDGPNAKRRGGDGDARPRRRPGLAFSVGSAGAAGDVLAAAGEDRAGEVRWPALALLTDAAAGGSCAPKDSACYLY